VRIEENDEGVVEGEKREEGEGSQEK